jgi:hypothetical protein
MIPPDESCAATKSGFNCAEESDTPHRSHAEGKEEKERTLKLGFISTHFYNHSIGRILIEMFIFLRRLKDPLFDIKIFFIDRDFHRQSSVETELTEPKTGTGKVGMHDMITEVLEKNYESDFIRIPDDIMRIRETVESAQLDLLVRL